MTSGSLQAYFFHDWIVMQLLFLDVLQWMYHYDIKTGSSKQVLYEMT